MSARQGWISSDVEEGHISGVVDESLRQGPHQEAEVEHPLESGGEAVAK